MAVKKTSTRVKAATSSRTKTSAKKPTRSKAVVRSGGRKLPFGLTGFQLKVIALVFVLGFGIFGALKIIDARAAVLTKVQCNVLGRPYGSDTCYRSCQTGAGTLVTTVSYPYCTNAISTGISTTKCRDLNRSYMFYGCARRWVRTATSGVAQCYYTSYTYIPVTSGYDYCTNGSAPTTTTTTTTSWYWPADYSTSINNGYSSSHYGIDIKATVGSYVRAVAAGTVVKKGAIGYGCGYGVILKVQSPSGSTVYPVYQHINIGSNTNDNVVAKGEIIGTVANVGVSSCWTGAHLHFGVQTNASYFYSPAKSTNGSYFYNPCGFLSAC